MTASHTAPTGFPQNLLPLLQRSLYWLGKGALAIAIIFLAGVLAIATAVAGLALAATALIMRLFGTSRSNANVQEQADGAAMTLEARKTPRGWTVE